MPRLSLGLTRAETFPPQLREELEEWQAALVGAFNANFGAEDIPKWSERLDFAMFRPNTQTDKSTTSATLADVDAAALWVKFKGPRSTRVLVRQSAYVLFNSAGNTYAWGLREGSVDVAGAGGIIAITGLGSYVSQTSIVENLTPGRNYFWKWAHATTGGATGTIRTHNGKTNAPPAIMEAWSF